MKVVGYARVSSRNQALDSNALEQQVERLKHAGAEKLYIDIESGYKGNRRQELERLLEDVRAKQVSKVIVTRVDRLSRRGKQWFTLVEDFIKAEVQLVVLDEPIDLTTAAGKMQAGIAAVLAQHHSDQKSEAVKHGWEHLRNKKIAMNPPFGLMKLENKFVKDTRPFLSLVEGHQTLSRYDIAMDMKELFFKERSIRMCLRAVNTKYGISITAHRNDWGGRVARDVFRFSAPGFRTWLLSPVLRGHTRYLKRRKEEFVIPDTHPEAQIITEVEFAEIEQILAKNKDTRGFGSTRQKWPLSGLIFCGECNATCYKVSATKGRHKGVYYEGKNHYYQCKNWGIRGCSQQKMVPAPLIETEVIEALSTKVFEITSYATTEEQPLESKELVELRRQLITLEALDTRNPAIKGAIEQLKNQIQVLTSQNSHNFVLNTHLHQLMQQYFRDIEYWQSLTNEQKIPVYRALVKKIIVKDGTVQSIQLSLD